MEPGNELDLTHSFTEFWNQLLLRTHAVALRIEDQISKALADAASSTQTQEKTADLAAEAVSLSGESDASPHASTAS